MPPTTAIELKVSGSEDAERIEVSIDGSPYRRCVFEGGSWSYHWHASLAGEQPQVAVLRAIRKRL